jgi:hypothetical protein
LAQLRHFSPEIEFTELLLTNLISWIWVNVMLLRIEPRSVKYKFAGLTTKPTVKFPWKSQTSFKMLYITSMNSISHQILGFQNTGIWHLFKNSNSGVPYKNKLNQYSRHGKYNQNFRISAGTKFKYLLSETW